MRHEHLLFPIIGRLCALRATTERCRIDDVGVVTLANFIDSDLEDWKNSLPLAFSYSTIQSANDEAVFSGTYDVYGNSWIAAIWNLYRCARILTLQVITCWLDHNSMPNPAIDGLQRRRSHNLLSIFAYEICASVPFILGATRSSLKPTQAPRAATGISLLWPLYVTAIMDQKAPGMHAWIITRLELIGQTMGVKQADCVAKVLRAKKEITAWERFETVRSDEVINDW